MSVATLRELLGAAEEQYRLLLDEATALLRDFDSAVPEDFDRVLERRADSMTSLQKIDSAIGDLLAKPTPSADPDDAAALEAFRTFREEATRRIIEIDSLVMALARERLDHLQQEMGALSQGKTALHGYETSGRERSNHHTSTA